METKMILVTGDAVIDHHLIKGNKSEASDFNKIGTTLLHTYGGAKLTFDLLKGFVKPLKKETKPIDSEIQEFDCIWPFIEGNPELGSTQGSHRDSYLRWEIEEKGKPGKEEKSFRLCEKLGFGGQVATDDDGWFKTNEDLNQAPYPAIVIDEAGIGFRNNKGAWPAFEKAGKIILKTTYPLCEGLLWNELQKHKDKLVTIINLNHLKRYNIKVSNDISWEQTALDIVYGLNNDRTLVNLFQSKEVIITIGSAGAIIINTNKDKANNEYTLVYDPVSLENEWEQKYKKDIINKIGLGSSFLAGFVAASTIIELDIFNSIKLALNTMNAAMLKGVFDLSLSGGITEFKPMNLSSALTERFKDRYYSSAFVPSPFWSNGLEYLNNPGWSILENNYDNHKKTYAPKGNLFPLAFSLAQQGVGNLHYAPRLTLGEVTIFDRNEIENLRNIRAQIDFYDAFENGKKPLNITVFGPPGAGKSFIVKKLANTIFDGKNTKPEFLTFNLSQFKDESELPGAFHAIRDSVLRGKLPIVFWDEFDSNDYNWLKSMIAPMQDGEFQEGKEVHPIGKSVFIFAGGMTYTMQHFAEKMDQYVSKKGPDFLSRISCSLNVFGPNPKPFKDGAEWKKEGDKSDICYSIRRALFIRSILGSDNKPIRMNFRLLRALIEVGLYKNGSRGLERLLKNFATNMETTIEPSNLPSKEIIQMNVDYTKLMERLADESNSKNISFEKIAVSIHKAWLDIKVKESAFNEVYEDLCYDGRWDNISAALRMKEVIESTGKFELLSDIDINSKGLTDGSKDFLDHINEPGVLNQMAEMEHNGWMETRRIANWQPGPRSNYHKIHPCMVAFNDLDKGIDDEDLQEQKNKDRNAIRNYIIGLMGSGFTIVKKV
jgi:hypothetical protein